MRERRNTSGHSPQYAAAVGRRQRGTPIDEVGKEGSTQDPIRRGLCAVGAAALWIGAGGAYLALEAIAAAGFRPHYSYAHDYISDLGVAPRSVFQGRMIDSPFAYLMNTAFYLQGTCFLLGAILMVRAVGSRKARLFLTLAAANAVGNILVGTIHGGPIAEVDGMAWVHRLGAGLAIAGGNIAILAGSALARNAGAKQWYRAASLGLAVLGLGSFTMLIADSQIAAISVLPDGVWERASVYSIIAWQTLTAGYLVRLSRLDSDAVVRGQQ